TVLCEDTLDSRLVADILVEMHVGLVLLLEARNRPCRRRLVAEEVAAHVVINANHGVALPGEEARTLRPDQSSRSGDNDDRHSRVLLALCGNRATTAGAVSPAMVRPPFARSAR